MNFQPIKIALLAGSVASETFSPLNPTAPDGVIIVNRNKGAVDHVDRVAVHLLPGFTQLAEQGQAQINHAVTVSHDGYGFCSARWECSLAQHCASFLQISSIIWGRYDRGGHDFRIPHLKPVILFMIIAFNVRHTSNKLLQFGCPCVPPGLLWSGDNNLNQKSYGLFANPSQSSNRG